MNSIKATSMSLLYSDWIGGEKITPSSPWLFGYPMNKGLTAGRNAKYDAKSMQNHLVM
jgi:hypothetical protein